ncbi:unnamed protein product [Adineta steineri]|uniref:mitogen-activated protein kinase kinase n=1 Tax=Adineta steineri TaxID=433720 RepID=A0A815ZVQ7_9BILA|nr:unnamed protein product [Adineta steineri]CAF1587153.1 unnamed protein product [Adineta steineri]
MANPEENLFVDTNNGEESGQPQNNNAAYDTPTNFKELCDHEIISPDDSITNISEINYEDQLCLPTTVSPLNCQEIPQLSESFIQKLLLFDVEEKQEPVQVTQYISKIPENSTVFTYDQTIIPIDVSQLDKCAKITHDGYFGEVYSVNIKNPCEIRIAVKRIPFRTDENSRLSTYAELSTMEMISSGKTPYIIDYYCSMIDLNTRELCICMELMDTSVKKFYQAMHRLPELSPDKIDRFVQRCAYNVVRALYYLESKSIVHRDVKPANILINKNGKIKLCDFGICGNLTDRQLDFDAVVGTAMYLPPEPEKCAIQGDMWALGISLIEIIAGKHPFADYQSYGIAYKIKEWEPTVPTTVSVETQAFILQLLRKEAGERPRSYMDIMNDLFIRYMTEIPSDDEIDFIQRVIEENSSFSSISGG